MNRIKIAALSAVLISGPLFGQKLSLRAGNYQSSLQLDSVSALPVRLSVEESGKQKFVVIKNAGERIVLQQKKGPGDSVSFLFPDFNSELRVKAKKKKSLSGYWINYNKGANYRIPFSADLAGETASVCEKPAANITGNWESYFDPESTDKEAAVGVFEQDGQRVTGTFLTETGDYRFMEGTVCGNSFYLSAFDGSHAFMVEGTASDSVIGGTFRSGKHYSTTLRAVKNPSFALRDPESLTFMKTPEAGLSFSLKDLTGKDYNFPNEDMTNKVVIVQIMGTWCPNCMDETNFFRELYAKYHGRGLEVISVGYEASDNFDEQAAQIRKLKERKKLDFVFLVGGKASKGIAAEQFSMLNQVMSFPTTIFVGRDGTVKRVHTGFNGPGTGAHYTEYVEKTTALIEEMLEN
jgi:thiol-disulfide isomerase/thioredoxin